MARVVTQENRGAGFYGGSDPTHKTTCANSNNPHGHSRECPCDWFRASQVIPYAEDGPDV